MTSIAKVGRPAGMLAVPRERVEEVQGLTMGATADTGQALLSHHERQIRDRIRDARIRLCLGRAQGILDADELTHAKHAARLLIAELRAAIVEDAAVDGHDRRAAGFTARARGHTRTATQYLEDCMSEQRENARVGGY